MKWLPIELHHHMYRWIMKWISVLECANGHGRMHWHGCPNWGRDSAAVGRDGRCLPAAPGRLPTNQTRSQRRPSWCSQCDDSAVDKRRPCSRPSSCSGCKSPICAFCSHISNNYSTALFFQHSFSSHVTSDSSAYCNTKKCPLCCIQIQQNKWWWK